MVVWPSGKTTCSPAKKRRTRGPYKKHEKDSSVAIPQVTFYRMRLKMGLVKRRPKKGDRPKVSKPKASSYSEPLFEGAKITTEETILAIMAFLHHHQGTTKAGLRSLLDLLKLHMVEGVSPRHLQSLYKFCKQKQECFNYGELIVTIHHTCPECMHLFEEAEEDCPTKDCHGKHYEENTREPTSFFVELDAEQQIKQFFTDPEFVNALLYRRSLPSDDILRDVYDGTIYQRHMNFLSSAYNLSLMWHTDGVEVYKCSDKQLWPVQAVINELPPSMRFSKKNIVIFSLYFGPGKPEMNAYLTLTILSLNKMHVHGIEIQPGGKGPMQKCHVLPLASTMDLPAVAVAKTKVNSKDGKMDSLGNGIAFLVAKFSTNPPPTAQFPAAQTTTLPTSPQHQVRQPTPLQPIIPPQPAATQQVFSQTIPQAVAKKALDRGVPSLAVRSMGKAMFGSKVLATSTVGGTTKKGSMKSGWDTVQALDASVISDITNVIMKKWPTHPCYKTTAFSFVKSTLGHLCRDEVKRERDRRKKEQADRNREVVPEAQNIDHVDVSIEQEAATEPTTEQVTCSLISQRLTL